MTLLTDFSSNDRESALYSNDFLLSLYKAMFRIRICEESLVDAIAQGKVKTPCHLYSGQEAIAVGVCAALQNADMIFGCHRSHGHYLAKGGDMRRMIAEIYGKKDGCCSGRGGSMHLTAPEKGMMGSVPIVAGTVSLAAGAALASKIRGDDKVTVSFFGDGATGEGVVYESLNFASLNNLPIIFACENNYYSTHMPLGDCRSEDNIFKTSLPFSFTGQRVDGNDVMAVHKAAKKAVEACRKGRGPVFIEFMTYRLRGHVGPDDNIQGTHTDIRPKGEIEKWKKKDPIKKFERILLKRGVVSKERLKEVEEEIESEVFQAHLFATNSPSPDAGELSDNVFRN